MSRKSKNKGAIIPLVALAMFSLLAIAGAAMDFSHVFVARSTLQNALDAAALSAAKSINAGESTFDSATDGNATFAEHIKGTLSDETRTPVYEFSATLSPFTPGAIEPDASYVRVTLVNHPVNTSLLRVVPGIGDFLNIGGTAVAGPIPIGTDDAEEVCDLAPLIACGDPDADCNDEECFGYPIVTEDDDLTEENTIILKTGSGKNYDWEIGPGNFQLAELECGTGGACLRREIAGAGEGGCVNLSEDINTEPGDTVGPTAQGFNTRFGDYQGPIGPDEAPPDRITEEGIPYGIYLDRNAEAPENWDEPDGVLNRRILAVQIGNCTGTENGRGTVERLGIGCFFMIEKASHKGNEQQIVGQFIEECPAEGESGTEPGEGPSMSAYKIVLYKDPDSEDT